LFAASLFISALVLAHLRIYLLIVKRQPTTSEMPIPALSKHYMAKKTIVIIKLENTVTFSFFKTTFK
jgi:hypothetical protein